MRGMFLVFGLALSTVNAVADEVKEDSPHVRAENPTELLRGDRHAHSSFSMDANALGNTRLDPGDAHRFARGETVTANSGQPVRLDRPLNFLVVVDSKFELFVADPEESIRFYTSLGFEVAGQEADGYTTLRNGPAVVALSPVATGLPLRWFGFLRRPPIGTEIVLYADRLEEPRAALEAAGYAPGPIRQQPWGHRDFRVSDPDADYLRISEGRTVPASK